MPSSILLPPQGLLADGTKPGGWWHETDEPGRVVCDLCPRECNLRPGDRGFCFVRENREGQMVLSTYGRSTGFCIDPIEKKPLNHFYPGTSVLSFGTAGCNLGCKFCQNWDISKSREIERLSEIATPEAIAEAAGHFGCRSVAFTYNDPVIWAEYAIDTAKACHAVGVKTVAVTAGYITPAARGAFYEHMDAANVDLKGFTEDFYYHTTLSHLAPVLETLRWLKHETDVWFEITNLVIPQANDSMDEIGQMCDWILEAIGPDVPLHFTAFHPDFRMLDRPRTPAETLLAAYEVARRRGLNYVYVGNVHAPPHHSTFCPGCGKLLIGRQGYDLTAYQMRGSGCGHCGTAIPGRFDSAPGKWGSRRLPVRIANFGKTRETVMAEPTLVQIEPAVATPAATELTAEHEQAILRSAVQLLCAATQERPLELPAEALAGAAHTPVNGAFVSLKRKGRLRCCCGFVGKQSTLLEALVHAAGRTANDDHRFPPVSPSELAHLDVEVWLLDRPQMVSQHGEERRAAVTIGKHGLQIARGDARGLLLPGVAVEHGFDADAFLQQVCLKAGLPPTAWKEDDATLMTFEGRSLHGAVSTLLTAAPADVPTRFSQAEVTALTEFCRTNIQAAVRGATPSYYAYGVSDGNVYGVAVTVDGPDGTQWLHGSRISLRQSMPLQSTLYNLAESLGQTLARRRLDDSLLNAAQVGLTILSDPAMHGTVSEPDLGGHDPSRRALVVMERHRSALVFDPSLASEQALKLAAEQTRLLMPQSAGVFSMAAISNRPRMVAAQGTVPQAGPSVRPPGVAGRFYPGDAASLNKLVDQLVSGDAPPAESWPAVMVPHAGLIFSGRLAADTLRRVKIPPTVIVIGPKHTPHGVDWAVSPHATWSIPGATLAGDPQLARQLAEAIPGLELDAAAHQQEHAIEVELPLLARLAPAARVIGIAIGAGDLATCNRFAEGLAGVIGTLPEPPLLVISSDMNHFATDAENRRLDELALSAMEQLDPSLLLQSCESNHISMCGVLPAVIVMETLRRMNQLTRTRRVGYATSADVSGDKSRVVGYAGMLLG